MTAVFVTGGAGFIGKQLVLDLMAAGHVVTALEHRSPVQVRGATAVAGDISDITPLLPALRAAEHVVHSAALLDPVDSAAAADRINHRATVELARAAAAQGVRTFVFLSSISAIGFQARAGLVREDAACAPTTFYGRAKRDAEIALQAEDLGSMRLVIVRPPTVYGPDERRNFLSLARAVARGRVFVPGDGANRMSFCHVRNLSRATLHLIDERRASGIVHVADATPVTFRQVIDTLRAALEKRGPLPRVPLALARALAWGMQTSLGPGAPLTLRRLRTLTADFALDTRRLAGFGVTAPISFQAGVQETVDAYRAAGVLARA